MAFSVDAQRKLQAGDRIYASSCGGLAGPENSGSLRLCLKYTIEALQLAVHSNPHLSRGRAFLAAAEALAGNIDGAKQRLAEYAAIDPGMTVRRFAKGRTSVPLEAVSPGYLRGLERILEALRRAGMPEQ